MTAQTVTSAQQQPVTNGAAKTVTCPSCGGESTVDARFCRLCGSRLDTPVADLAPSAAAASVPEEIDTRRARQLVDRASQLLERGHINSAVLSCRQAVALAPTMAGVHSMLGLFLERAGDPLSAAQAYEKALQIDPENAVDRDALTRLRSRGELSRENFAFNDDELFDVATDSVGSPGFAPQPIGADSDATSDSSTYVMVAPSEPALPRGNDRRSLAVPVAVDRRRSTDRRAPLSAVLPPASEAAALAAPPPAVGSMTAGTMAAATAAAVAARAGGAAPSTLAGKAALSAPTLGPLAPLPTAPMAPRPRTVPPPAPLHTSPVMRQEMADGRPTVMQAMRHQPAWFWRGAPVAAATVMGLAIIVLAHSRAPVPIETAPTAGASQVSASTSLTQSFRPSVGSSSPTVPTPVPAGPAIITNASNSVPSAPSQPDTSTAAGRPRVAAPARSGGRAAPTTGGPLAPLAVGPAGTAQPAPAAGTNGGIGSLPPRR